MHKNTLGLLLILFVLLSCNQDQQKGSDKSTEDQVFTGTIGENLNAELVLNFTGDRVTGKFIHLTAKRKPIDLDGIINGKKLRLNEFDEEGKLSGEFLGTLAEGTYSGMWEGPTGGRKVPFSFMSNKRNDLTARDEQYKRFTDHFSAEDLLREHFSEIKMRNQKSAFIKDDNQRYIITLETVNEYELTHGNYALVLFSKIKYFEDQQGKMSDFPDCHGCYGVISVAKYQLKSGKWALDKFFAECNCGPLSFGRVVVPELRLIGDRAFLVSETGYFQGGISEGYLSVCNVEDFKTSFFAITELDSGASLLDKSFNAHYRIEDKQGDAIITIKEKGDFYDKKIEKWQKVDRTRLFDYSDRLRKFREQK